MSSFIFKAEKRESFGTSHSRRLRKQGLIPAVIYANNKDPIGLSLIANSVNNMITNEAVFSSIIDIELGDQKIPALIKQVQYHPFKGQVIHIDFLLVDQNVEITTHVPLHFIGAQECIGVKENDGVFIENLLNVEINCLPKDLPEYIEVNVSHLDIGDNVHLSNLKIPAGVSLTELSHGEESNDAVVCSVEIIREQIEEAEEETQEHSEDQETEEGKEDTQTKETKE